MPQDPTKQDITRIQYDVAIVGAGPAGLMAAMAAAAGGASVVVCEQLRRPGLKLLATGGGRCNLTHVGDTEEFLAAYGRQGRFASPALEALDSQGLRDFFAALTVPTHEEGEGLIFPNSGASRSVEEALLNRCEDLGVVIRTGCQVNTLLLTEGRVSGLETSVGTVRTPRVIVAAGGSGYPDLGGTGGGYELARQAGHDIVPLTPALVPLVTKEDWIRRCPGVSFPGRVWIDLPRQSKAGRTGDILFTHTGISGPAVLNLSADVGALLAKQGPVPIRIDLRPDFPKDRWLWLFDQWQQRQGTRLVRKMLALEMPTSMAEALVRVNQIDPRTLAAHFPAEARERLASSLNSLPLTVVRTEGFDRAMVTRGGVNLKQVDPHTLSSRLCEGLYFAGEVLDLDGPSGGYNLQWAFSSGHLAGKTAGTLGTSAAGL